MSWTLADSDSSLGQNYQKFQGLLENPTLTQNEVTEKIVEGFFITTYKYVRYV